MSCQGVIIQSVLDEAPPISAASAAHQPQGAQRRLRIGLLIDRFEPQRGGAEGALQQLAQHAAQRGHTPVVLSKTCTATGPVEFHRVRGKGITRATRERRLAEDLVRAAKDQGCNVTVGVRHLRQVDLYWPHDGAYAASLSSKYLRQGRPRSLSDVGGHHRVFLELERSLLAEGGARKVACVSELVERELGEMYPACRDRLLRCDNGVDLDHFHPRHRAQLGQEFRAHLGLPQDLPLVVFVGGDPLRKGLDVLLRALWRCRAMPWFFVAAGIRQRLGWLHRIELSGLDRRRFKLYRHFDARTLLAAADLCVLPTWRDSCGLVVLESLASGTPVLVTSQAGASQAISDARAGEVLPSPADEDALTQALARWLVRAREPGLDRDAVRACALQRAKTPWLERLGQEIERLARET